MIDKYYKTLELHKILEMLEKEASNERTREMVSEIHPLTDLDDVKAELGKTACAYDLAVKYGSPSFTSFQDITGALKKAEAGASLSFHELLMVAKMLNQIRSLSDWYRQVVEDTPIGYIFESLTPNRNLEERIYDSILSDTEMADSASSALASIRRKITQAGMRIRETLDKMIKSQTTQKYLQDAIVTIRDGRYVLPVKSEHKNNVQGLVHDTSATGSTLFIEPISVVEANNDIRVLKGKEQEEIERITAELSAACAQYAASIKEDYKSCAELNLYFAKANLAVKMNACLPEVSDDGRTELKKARHPLIDKEKVVPINLRLGYDYNALIITGPNTGGKTVVLKTLGLLTSMVMCGMMIPAGDGTRISVFRKILADIGDQQSIEQSLSTFSAHMNKVVEILSVADEHSLILLDELGSGTDPVEGAALAVSIIEKLKSQGSRMMVTTHYQELKMYAIETEGVENASCEFDTETLRPTYRLIIGYPGKSNAFEISSRLGLSDEVICKAKSLVSEEDKHFEDIIEQLEQARFELYREKEEAQRLRKENEARQAELERQLAALEKSKETELEQARLQAMRIVEGVRFEADKLVEELDELKRQRESEDFAKRAAEARSKSRSTLNKLYRDANPVTERNNDDYVLPRPLKRGDSVLVVDIDKKGIVAGEPDGSGNVFVQLGVMKTKVKVSRLRLVEEQVTVNNKKPPRSGGKKGGIQSKIDRTVQMELDIRGMTVTEGIADTDIFIDNAVMSNMGIVTIIHGKGTGTLRKAIHDHLKHHPSVKSYRLGVFGEGEDGVTIVELK